MILQPKKVQVKQTLTNRSQLLQKSQSNISQTQRQKSDILKRLNTSTHQIFEHDLRIEDSEVDKQYQKLKSEQIKAQNNQSINILQKFSELKKNQESQEQLGINVIIDGEQAIDKHHDIYNMMAQSIIKKKKEVDSIIELNKDKYVTSPYRVKHLKIRPPIIYPKDNKDQLFLMSEADRKIKTFSTSHYKFYGEQSINRAQTAEKSAHRNIQNTSSNPNNQTNTKVNLKFNLNVNKAISGHQQIDLKESSNYKDLSELRRQEQEERERMLLNQSQQLSQSYLGNQEEQFNMTQTNIKIVEQRKFNQQQIEESEKKLIKQALFFKKKERAEQGFSFGSQQILQINESSNTQKQQQYFMYQNVTSPMSQQNQSTSKSQTKSILNDKVDSRKLNSSQKNIYSDQKSDQSLNGVYASKGRNLYFKRQRYSVNDDDNKQNKELQQKLKKLQEETLKKMESYNIKPPSKWQKQVQMNQTMRESSDAQSFMQSSMSKNQSLLQKKIITAPFINEQKDFGMTSQNFNQRSKTPLQPKGTQFVSAYENKASTANKQTRQSKVSANTYYGLDLQQQPAPSITKYSNILNGYSNNLINTDNTAYQTYHKGNNLQNDHSIIIKSPLSQQSAVGKLQGSQNDESFMSFHSPKSSLIFRSKI